MGKVGDTLFLSIDTETINVENVNSRTEEQQEIYSSMMKALDTLSEDTLGMKVQEGDRHDSVLRSVQVLAYNPKEWYVDAENGDFTCKPGIVSEMYKRAEIYTDKTVVPYFQKLVDSMGKRDGTTKDRCYVNVIAFAWNGEGFDIPVLNTGTHGALWHILLKKCPEPKVIANSINRIKTAIFEWKLGSGHHSTTCKFMIVDSMKTYKINSSGSLAENALLAQPWVGCSAFYKTKEYDYNKLVSLEKLPEALPLTDKEAHYSKMDVVLQAGIIAYKSYLITKDWQYSKEEVRKNGYRLLQLYWLHCFSATMVNRYTTDLTAMHHLPDTPNYEITNKVNYNTLQNLTGFRKHLYQQNETEDSYVIAHDARGGGQITINWLYWLKPINHLYSLDDSSHYPYVMLTYPYPSRFPVEITDPGRFDECMRNFSKLTKQIMDNRNNHNLLPLVPEFGTQAYSYKIAIMNVRWHYTDRLYPCFSVEGKMAGQNIKTISGKLFSADYIDSLTLDYPSMCCLLDNYDFDLLDIKFFDCGSWIPAPTYKFIQVSTEGERKTRAKVFKNWAIALEKDVPDVKKRIEILNDEIDDKDLPVIKVTDYSENGWKTLINRVKKYYDNSKIGLNALYGAEYQDHLKASVTVDEKGNLVIDNKSKVYTPKDQRREAQKEQGGHDYLCGEYTASWGRLIINTVGNYMYDISDNIRVCYQHTDSIKIASIDGTDLGMDYVDEIAKKIYDIIPHCKTADKLGFGKFDNEKDHYAPVAMVFGHGQMITGGKKAKATWLGINLDIALEQKGILPDLSNLLDVLKVGQEFEVTMDEGKNLRTSFDVDCSGKYIPSADMYTVPVIRGTNRFTMLPNYEKTKLELMEAQISID